MFAAVADTHTALWYLSGDERLSLSARTFILHAAASRQRVAISPISLAELVYLIEKRRLPQYAYEDLRRALDNPRHVFAEAVFDSRIAHAMHDVPRNEVPDMPDRMIAATAVSLGVPLISRDGLIRSSRVVTIW